MNRHDFFKEFQGRHNLSAGDAEKICRDVFGLMAECIDREERLYINGLGTFTKRKLAPRTVGDINNGGTMEIPETTKVSFSFSPKQKRDCRRLSVPPVGASVAVCAGQPAVMAIADVFSGMLVEKIGKFGVDAVRSWLSQSEPRQKVKRTAPRITEAKRCDICKDIYKPTSNGQRYCSASCRYEQARRKKCESRCWEHKTQDAENAE